MIEFAVFDRVVRGRHLSAPNSRIPTPLLFCLVSDVGLSDFEGQYPTVFLLQVWSRPAVCDKRFEGNERQEPLDLSTPYLFRMGDVGETCVLLE